MNHPDGKGRTAFDQQWHERFVEFATLREDDAGIAGWSLSGLETRFRFFRQRWNRVAPESLYLDVGCGAATYTRWLADNGLSMVGLDYSQPTLAKARARTPTSIPLCAGDATRLPFAAATFDGALCFGVLQAVSDARPVATELARILKPDAELWIDALNGGGIAARVERARLRMRGKDMHLRYDSPTEIMRVLSAAGFGELNLHWLPILPSRIRWLQPVVESMLVRAILIHVPPLAAICSHAFVIHARRVTTLV